MNDSRNPNPDASVNALINETSPYLLQHAHNPVHWYPWSPEALALAKRENKPILLSIGYSACHWCHVMAHESFEDEDTAALMNQHFINIKVDREERPDIDKIYQTAQYLLTNRSGGWPLTMFLTHDDQVPFFGGTYFPPEPRYGMPGFKNILGRVVDYYTDQQDAVRKQNQAFMQALQQTQRAAPAGKKQPDPAIILQGVHGLAGNFDVTHGGFGGAPKFPHVTNLELLMAFNELDDTDTGETALQMSTLTLEKMASGGIYDHLGGGFCRYSVDDQWTIPHFEKMLYDNGPLLWIYLQAWHVTGDPSFKTIATETADWILRDMQNPQGGYYSSLDADSEGVEGKFYAWAPDQVQSLLGADEYALFAAYYGLEGPPNFEHQWHLRTRAPLAEIASKQNLAITQATLQLNTARHKLLETRRLRIWPGRDEKILPSWNALVIKAMALASIRLEHEPYYQSAEQALVFIHTHLWRNGRLIACYKDGKGHLNAYLDDYAFLLDAILTMLSVRWNSQWFDFAQQLAAVLIEQFEDKTSGGFYFTSHDHEPLLQRRRDFADEATPSGNGIAAQALLRIGYLTGNLDWIVASENTLKAAWPSIQQLPHAHPTLLLALADLANPPRQIIIRGLEPELGRWAKRCHQATGLRTAIYAIPTEIVDLPGALALRAPATATLAYVCEGHQCKLPEFNLENLTSDLKPQAPG